MAVGTTRLAVLDAPLGSGPGCGSALSSSPIHDRARRERLMPGGRVLWHMSHLVKHVPESASNGPGSPSVAVKEQINSVSRGGF